VELAKVDTDRNQRLSMEYRIQGIPAVKAFKDGRVATEFTGALPPAEVERFFDALVPSEADALASAGDEESLRRALEFDPRHSDARRELGRILLQRGATDEALDVLDQLTGDFTAEGLAARARLAESNGSLARAFSAWDSGDHAAALEALQEAFAEATDPDERDLIRRVMVGIFTELGPDDPLAREHRRRLSAALN